MPTLDLNRVKLELLCYGANCSVEVLNAIREINPYAGSNLSVHSASFLLDDTLWVNTPINEAFNSYSPYSIILDEEQFFLYKNSKRLCKVSIIVPPKWYDKKTSNGTKMCDVLNVHNKNVLAITHYVNCYYANIGKRCLYCSVTGSNIPQLLNIETRKQDIVDTLKEALQENADYSLALSEGTKNDYDRGAMFFSLILRKISESGIKLKTSVELAPPKDDYYIDLLYSCGVDSIIMNMEFYDDSIRRTYCPGKGEITSKQYFQALSYSTKLFGRGNVASVLIVGIEPINNTIFCARSLLDMGVLPIIMPFKPYDNCELANSRTTNPEDLITVSTEIKRHFQNSEFNAVCNSACISCGACNVSYYQ